MKTLISIAVGVFLGWWLSKKKNEIDKEANKNAHLSGVLYEMKKTDLSGLGPVNTDNDNENEGTGLNENQITLKSFKQPSY